MVEQEKEYPQSNCNQKPGETRNVVNKFLHWLGWVRFDCLFFTDNIYEPVRQVGRTIDPPWGVRSRFWGFNFGGAGNLLLAVDFYIALSCCLLVAALRSRLTT